MIHSFPYMVENQVGFIEDAMVAYKRFEVAFGLKDSPTQLFAYYNAFGLTSGSVHYHHLFRKIVELIKGYYKGDGLLWMQAWINFHKPHEVLPWHHHDGSMFHGYVPIQPHNTVTEFREFKIKNEVGNIYIGPSSLEHRVVCLEDFDTPRITLAFDCFDLPGMLRGNKGITEKGNIGVIPII